MKRLNANAVLEEFSEFGDKDKYNGGVPTAKYICVQDISCTDPQSLHYYNTLTMK